MELTPARPRLRTFLVVAAALLALLFSDALVSGRVLSQVNLLYRQAPWSAHTPAEIGVTNTLLGDAAAVFTPFLHEAARQVREGRLPLWSPRLFAGHPFLASYQTAVFSPFTWPAFVVPVVDALLVAAVLKLLTGGLGMWLLLRVLGLAPGAVLFGAVAYLLNPFSVVWLEHPLSAVAAWLPWLLWSIERLARSGSWPDTALTAAVAATCVLAGHPETTYKVGLLASAYALMALAGSRRPWRSLWLLACAAVVALTIAAVQVLPFVEYLQTSGVLAMRSRADANPYPAALETIVTAIVPNFYGNPSRGLYLPMENRFGIPSNFCEQQIYAGIPVWLLAAVGTVGRWHERRVRFFAAAATLATLLMYGTPGLIQAFLRVPGADVVVLTRLGLITIASAVVLAAFGLDLLLTAGVPRALRHATIVSIAATAGMLAAVAAFLLWAQPFLRANGLWEATRGWTMGALLLMLCTIAGVWLRARAPAPPRWLSAGAIALVALDLLAVGYRFHPMMPRQAVLPVVPEIARVQADHDLFRVAGIGDAMLPNVALLYGLQDLRGYDGMTPLAHAELLATRHGGGAHARLRPDDRMDLLDAMNVRYVFSGEPTPLPADRFTPLVSSPGSTLYRNDRVRPRAFLVGRVRIASAAHTLDLIRRGEVDLTVEALLPSPLSPSETAGLAAAPGSVRLAHYEDTRAVLDVDTPTTQLLVLSDLYYPGWRAELDGVPVAIHRTNHAMRGVVVPSGRHRITFVYAPWTVRAGGFVSLVGLGLLALMAVLGRRGN